MVRAGATGVNIGSEFGQAIPIRTDQSIEERREAAQKGEQAPSGSREGSTVPSQ